jgi:hypothetical protein
VKLRAAAAVDLRINCEICANLDAAAIEEDLPRGLAPLKVRPQRFLRLSRFRFAWIILSNPHYAR